MTGGTAMEALGWGLLSAVSLPLGAALGLWLRPSTRWTSSLMAFGAGALLAALTLELAAKSLARSGFWTVAVGFIVGALLFMELNRLLNGHGGFLRKVSTTTRFVLARKRDQAHRLIEHLGRSKTLTQLPPEDVRALVSTADPVHFDAAATVFEKGHPGDSMLVLETGEVEVVDPVTGDVLGVLGAGDIVGEMALLTGDVRSATVRCRGAVRGWSVSKEDMDRLMRASPRFADAVRELGRRRAGGQAEHPAVDARHAEEWVGAASDQLDEGEMAVTDVDVAEHSAHHGSAALAIWLGILLDGIPESLVIGTLTHEAGVGLTLIAGVFLANFPEALSSAVGMRSQGKSVTRILLMWGSLTVMTGLGALVGNLSATAMSHDTLAVMEAVAAGAMLAMIAETMLPEATEQGGPATGLMTVLGFLAAVFVSDLERITAEEAAHPAGGHGEPPAHVEPAEPTERAK